MRIGIDFDNTIVCYDSLFVEIASRLNIELDSSSTPKRSLQNKIRSANDGEWEWSKIQGEVYGPLLAQARPYPNLIPTLKALKDAGHSLCIISHKTRFPNAGPPYPFHKYALEWIDKTLGSLIPLNSVHLNETRDQKLHKIREERCDIFIDDLEDILADSRFPAETTGILFSPGSLLASQSNNLSNWQDLPRLLESIPSPEHTQNPSPFPDTVSHLERISSCINLADTETLLPLSGGVNSQVFRTSVPPFRVAKLYPTGDCNQRYLRETSFLQYAQIVAPDSCPQLLSSNADAQCSILQFIPGELASLTNESNESDALQCLSFLTQLQSGRNSERARALPPAAEACDSLQEHLASLSPRRNAWLSQALQTKSPTPWSQWICGPLEDAFQSLAKTAISHPRFKARSSRDAFIISPSDFGLHNAIRLENGTLKFIDFEYAGWDDPAKTLSDFFLQPRNNFPEQTKAAWREAFLQMLAPSQRTDVLQRLPVVEACCKMRWIYIILKSRLDPRTLLPKNGHGQDASLEKEIATRLDDLIQSLGPLN
ncbi:aminoglycoside phosphotransferase family protein [Pelagicoccus enzymogenes]|uniref:aminoglycoside phosphotransferase family protein n=1 Tax=Pelagicoccus enzymogenes TaxID=2773457 RepID=UPI00280EB8A5|nr:aminoglycoside phosphotransferase family protein [Pelagicoccus enzymogenes]MDQ8199168.1 aminoglycoside phosphotransferase family protein [Pelagicoccus enzymogenes]